MKEAFYKGSIGSLKEFWEDKGETGSFEGGYRIRLEGISKLFSEVKEFVNGKQVLDVGCGPGIVASLFPQNVRVVGLDFSISMLRSAKNRVQQMVRGNVFNLPFRDQVFEVATCFFVASDYSAKEDIFSEAYRILEHNGFFLFADYSLNDEHWKLRKAIRPLLGENCNIFIESEESLSNKLEKAGFKVKETRLIRFNPEFELGWYIRSEKELEQIKETDSSLWRRIQDCMCNKKVKREFILIVSKK